MRAKMFFLGSVLVFSLTGCALESDLADGFESESSEETVGYAAAQDNGEADDESIPYDPNAPFYEVHELKPIEADYKHRLQLIEDEKHLLHGDPIPDVPIIKWVRYKGRLKYVNKCLRKKGFDSKLEDDYTISAKFNDKSEAIPYDKAMFWCDAAYPYVQPNHRPLDSAQARKLYRYYIEKVIPCLQGLGYNGSYNLPSEEKFIAEVNRDPRYSPYPQVMTWEEQEAALKVCPLRPIYEEIWGRY